MYNLYKVGIKFDAVKRLKVILSFFEKAVRYIGRYYNLYTYIGFYCL